ncbi:MAG: hypothetical protein AAF355_11520 [Myxococcota bacterium]
MKDTRREFLIRVAQSFAAGAVSTLSFTRCGGDGGAAGPYVPLPDEFTLTTEERALAALGATYASVPQSFQSVAERYLDQAAPNRAPEPLESAMSPAIALLSPLENEQEAVAALESAVTQDFREGRTIAVDGWILSQIELSLAVLVHVYWIEA